MPNFYLYGKFSYLEQNDETKPKKKVDWEYYEEDMCKVWGYEKFIKKHIRLQSKIPARVLKVYFSLFEKTATDNEITKKLFLNNARKKVLDEIERLNQQFSFKSLVAKHPPRRRKDGIDVLAHDDIAVEFSATKFANLYFDRLIGEKSLDEIDVSKNAVIDDASKQLRYYLALAKNKETSGYPTKYNLTIIVALILVSFGQLMDEQTWLKSNSSYAYYTTYLNKSVAHLYDKAIAPIDKNTK